MSHVFSTSSKLWLEHLQAESLKPQRQRVAWTDRRYNYCSTVRPQVKSGFILAEVTEKNQTGFVAGGIYLSNTSQNVPSSGVNVPLQCHFTVCGHAPSSPTCVFADANWRKLLMSARSMGRLAGAASFHTSPLFSSKASAAPSSARLRTGMLLLGLKLKRTFLNLQTEHLHTACCDGKSCIL